MKNLISILVAITCCLGCDQTGHQNWSPTMLWEIELLNKIKEIDGLCKKRMILEKELINYSASDPIPADYYNLSFEIDRGIYELWTLSRRCLFLDFGHDELSRNTPLILDRYQKFLSDNKNISYDKLTLMNIESNINAINTPYYVHAVHVVQDSILFESRLYSTSPVTLISREEKIRELAQKAMILWYNDNRDALVWNEPTKSYKKVDGNSKLPTEVYRLMGMGD